MTEAMQLSREAQIADEVAARYGVTVRAAAVQIVPRGVSGLPQAIWVPSQNGLGGRLAYQEPAGWKAQKGRVAAGRRRGMAASPEVAARRERVRAAHADGLHDLAIAQLLGCDLGKVQADRRFLGLAAHVAPRVDTAPQRERAQRLKVLQDLHARGATDAVIAAQMGLHRKTVHEMREHLRLRAVPVDRSAARRRITDADLRQQVSDGRSDAEIAAAWAMKPGSVAQRRRALGLEPNRKPPVEDRVVSDDDSVETFRRLHASGLTLRAIAAEMKMAYAAATALRRHLGLQPQPRQSAEAAALAGQRRKRIADMVADIRAWGTVPTIKGIARALHCKPATVRRDLARLNLLPLSPPAPDRAAMIREAAEKGASRREIAGALGLSLEKLASVLRRLDIVLPKSKPAAAPHPTLPGRSRATAATTERRQQVAALARDGLSRLDIREATGMTLDEIARHLRAVGLTLPPAPTGRPRRAQTQAAVDGPSPFRREVRMAERRAEVARLAREGVPRRAIARRLRVSLDPVNRDLRALDIKVPRAPQRPSAGQKRRSEAVKQRRVRVADLRDGGLSVDQIAERLQCSRATVCADITHLLRSAKARRAHGVTPRQRRACDAEHAREILRLARDGGLSAAAIAARLRFSVGAVQRVIDTSAAGDLQEMAA